MASARQWLDIIYVITAKEMKVKYNSTVFGYLWSLAQPMAYALIYFIAFKIVMRIQVENYTLFLVSGLFVWQWFNVSTNNCLNVYLANASLVKKLNFSRSILPFSMVLIELIHFVLSLPVIFVLLSVYELPLLNESWVLMPVIVVLQFCFTFGVSLIVSSVNLFFRDLERIVSVLLTFAFYLTPVVYPMSMVPEKYQYLFLLNPMAVYVELCRAVFLGGEIQFFLIGLAGLYAVLFMFVGHLIHSRLQWRFAEIL